MTNLDVKDQAGTSSITVAGGVNSGNNGANWNIAGCSPPDVTVSVSPSAVLENGPTNLVYTFSRTGSTTNPLTVNFSVGGTAAFSSDYSQSGAASFNPTSGTVTIGAGNSTATVTLDPTSDSTVESDETALLTVTSGTGYNPGNPASASGTITNDDLAPPTMQFSATAFLVNEGGGSVEITVLRSGDTAGASSVDYRTTDTDTFTVNCAAKQGAAFARCDFATVVGTANFAAGETTKTFNVPIIDDSYGEGVETCGVALTNATGGSIGPVSTASVSITDNETVDGPNPILRADDPGIDFFVRQHYLDFLSREPEPGQPWSNVLKNCSDQFNTNPASPAAGCDRLTVSGAFFGSPEFKDKGIYVIDFYRVAFNRLPTYLEFVPDLASMTGSSVSEVNAKRATLANNFVQRSEFTGIYGAMNNTTFVNTLMSGGQGQNYNMTSITTPDPANPDGTNKVTLSTADLINQLTAGTLTRAQVLRAIVQSDQITQNFEAVNAFVASQYYGYLRRTPETGGFNQWVTYLRNNPTDFRTMVNGFLNSTEYRSRFGPVQ
jgi:hypothetical protein